MKLHIVALYHWRFLGDPNICVLRDEILFKVQLVKENINITVNYVLFSVLIFTDFLACKQ
jgi:hypothetical protein